MLYNESDIIGKTILIIDDEPDSLEVAETLLEDLEVIILTATNGAEGLAIALKERPDYIISDLSMPEMDGWEFIEAMKNNRVTMDIPVIALTAHAMPSDRTKAIAAGFHNFLTKPLNPETFVNDFIRVVIE